MRVPVGPGSRSPARQPFRLAGAAAGVAGLLAALLLTVAGCEDIRRFSGEWAGSVSADPALRHGFAPTATLRATVGAVSRSAIEMRLDLPDRTDQLPFEPLQHAAGDVLGELRLEGEPLRTFLGYVQPPGVPPYLAVVSLFADDRIEVRIIRGPSETYGVFSLRRSR